MTIGQAWRAVRQDPEWMKKAGLAALVNLIPYAGAFLVMGYALNYAQAAARGVDGGRLPSWGAFGDHARSALNAFVVSLVYSLPLMVLVMPLSLLMSMLAVASTESGPGAGFLAMWFAFIAVIIVLCFAYVPVTYAGLAAVVATGSLDASFRLRDVWERARRHSGLLISTTARILGIGLLGAAVPLGVGIPAFVAAMIAAEQGPRAGAAVLITAGFGVYLLSILLVIALSALVQLVAYRLLAEYARVAYDIPQPPFEAAA